MFPAEKPRSPGGSSSKKGLQHHPGVIYSHYHWFGRCLLIPRDFRISVRTRTELDFFPPLFPSNAHLNELYQEATELAYRYNEKVRSKGGNDYLSSGKLHAVAVLHQLYQSVLSNYLNTHEPDFFSRLGTLVGKNHDIEEVLTFYMKEFPSPLLVSKSYPVEFYYLESLRGYFIHQVMEENPALIAASKPLLKPEGLFFPKAHQALTALMGGYAQQRTAAKDDDLFSFLTRPARLYPDSLLDQIRYILEHWADMIDSELKRLLLRAIDYVQEEEKPHFPPGGPAPPMPVIDYSLFDHEYEAFTADRNWMPNVVMIAKSTLVWLDQLTKEYGYPIDTLDKIPEREIELLAQRGFTALWLIGIWERSSASKMIKNLTGNPDAEASAYSLRNYEIASLIGGWGALDSLRHTCSKYGVRLASDMVPNHTGIDSDWVMSNPDLFIWQRHPPFPSYTFDGPNLSPNPNVEIKLEDHYYDRSDAAVTFQRRDLNTGETHYIFHGNDGTSMPWNDTAQLDFLNPKTREMVYQQIKHVAMNFPIIRFDAAMTLAKKHIQRLWYPRPGRGGDIAGRVPHSLDDETFHRLIPNEFWREVVDRINEELPDTLLLAEAFWMMEGYFVRTLGMHRVYNSAFMNMLKNQENKKYRDTIKNTLIYEPEILKRFVNFMNNPDEETAIAQFGDGDKYFGVCTLLATMPGLPMFGHGQVEGFREKYGMEYRRAYWDETANQHLVDEHYRRIFPLLKRRYLYSDVEYFELFDLVHDGHVHESAFCYVNGTDTERSLILYNNQYEKVEGTIKHSSPKLIKQNGGKHTATKSLAESLGLTVSGRRFVIWDSFTDKLTYMSPSLKLFDDGLWVHLWGFETKVFLNIREVEDSDGVYAELYERIGGQGIANFEEEIMALRLRPVTEAMENLRSESFFSLLSSIFDRTSSSKAERTLLLSLGEAYAHLTTAYELLHPQTKKILNHPPRDPDVKAIMETVKRLNTLFADHSTRLFSQSRLLLDELEVIVSSAFFLNPFVGEDAGIEEVVALAERLQLCRFYAEKLNKAGFVGDDQRKACQSGAIVVCAHRAYRKGEKPQETLARLLEEERVRTYGLVNEYQGVIWFDKERMQELIFLSALSIAMSEPEFDPTSYVKTLFDAQLNASYRLKRLLALPE